MRKLKYHPHGSVLFITFSVEEGLFLLANPLCEAIVQSCLSRAQFLYPVKICHFIVQATHVHLIIVVQNPDDVSGFIRYFKTESAHMLNAILGRRKRTIWCEGYDSPIVLTPIRALIAITYIYANPSKDNLEESIDRFPGLSSWGMFRRKENSKTWKRLRRPAFKELPQAAHNLHGYTREAQRLLTEATESYEFKLDPDAWMSAFGFDDLEKRGDLNKCIVQRVRKLEERALKQRTMVHSKVIGRDRLRSRPIDPLYRPQRSGQRSYCLTEDRSLRIRFINFLKDLYTRAREIAVRWKLGDFSLSFPLGLYPPSMPKLADRIGVW